MKLTADQVKVVAFVLGKEIKGAPLGSLPECKLKVEDKREKTSVRTNKSLPTDLYSKSRRESEELAKSEESHTYEEIRAYGIT